MKKIFLAIATILLLTQAVSSQVLLKSDEEQIRDIDKMSQEIKTNLNSYDKTEKNKDSSGYRYVYSKGEDLKLITVFSKDSSVNKKVEWYFHNGQLIYAEQIWTDRITNKIVNNEKFYLNNNYLFAWFKDDKKVDVTSQDFKLVSDNLYAYATKLKDDNLK